MSFAQIIKNIIFLLVSIFSGVTLLLVSVGVSSGNQLAPFNAGVEEIFNHLRLPVLTNLMVLVTNIGSPLVLAVIAVVLSIFLVLQHDLYDTMLYAASILSTVAVFMLIRNESFPSGHAALGTAFFFATGYSFFTWPKHWPNRVTLVTLCVFGAGLVSFARLYLQSNSALDVLAGATIGLLSVSLTVLVFNMFLSERRFWRQTFRGL